MSSIASMINLKGRRALITGAMGGLGSVMASTLAELGADLVLVDLPGKDLGEMKEQLVALYGVEIDCHQCDLERPEQRQEMARSLIESGHGLSVLVNNAAFVGTSGLVGWAVPYEQQASNTWNRVLEVNLISVFDLCQRLTPLLSSSCHSSIVNIASIYGQYGPDWSLYADTTMSNPAAYAASKGGLIQLTRWLSTTLAPTIRVNAISPGGVLRGQPAEFIERYSKRTPMARMATEEDFRGAIAYLASDLSLYVTGQVLNVDGGWGAW
ncbi:MAG: SDR family oxidoreductase [Verrucomicrobiae bacterium]|nr:SDR family oxidoreductase [Verrucomicrobiae bacterium]